MQSARRISKSPSKIFKRILFKPSRVTTRKMSFFPSSYLTSSNASPSSFSPLFRLLDDFEQHSRQSSSPSNTEHQHRHNGFRTMKSFTPKFDVKEVADAYELHGELPGIEQKDVEIEFTDESTIVIKGHTEKSYTRGTPPAGFIESAETAHAITEKGESKSGEKDAHHVTPHKATVEDEDAANKNTETTVAQSATPKDSKPAQQETAPEERFWVSERSIGEFQRSFSFPVRVDADAVTASMKNGILSIVIPKSKKRESRKITIQ